MKNILAIAVSADITYVDYIYENLDSLLASVGEYDIIAINDSNHLIDKYAQQRSKMLTTKMYTNRVGARQALAGATHAVIFWSGYDLHDIIFLAHANKLRLKIFPISITTVVNKDSGQLFDVYIGRGSPLGNPFPIQHGTDKDREYVIEKYREYFYKTIISMPT